jgi:hypothetical protein
MDETHFQSVHLAPSEISWLKAHDSLEKVLNLTCLAYAAAPKWEPYPQGLLSVEDLQKMEHEKETHRKAIEEANRLSQLIVLKGDNVYPTQEIVKYGMRNTGWVAAQLARAKNKSSQKKKKKGETVEALITAATAIHDGKCDVLECTEEAVGKCNHYSVSSTSKCSNRSYCTLHIAHTSHDLQTLKVVNKVRFLFTMPTEYSYDYTSLFSAADDCR